MLDYVRGLLGPVGRRNSPPAGVTPRQLAEYAGHTTPHGLQHLLPHSRWDADGVRDDLQTNVAEQLGHRDGVLILDDTGFVKEGHHFRRSAAPALRHGRPYREVPDRRLRRLRHHYATTPWSTASLENASLGRPQPQLPPHVIRPLPLASHPQRPRSGSGIRIRAQQTPDDPGVRLLPARSIRSAGTCSSAGWS
ncbi:transposase [Streptomyces capillispiralis]|uniref:transposase n=1 Tax=Streptomyces capillispiralis TaxID=68182 RepID=UPI00368D73EC